MYCSLSPLSLPFFSSSHSHAAVLTQVCVTTFFCLVHNLWLQCVFLPRSCAESSTLSLSLSELILPILFARVEHNSFSGSRLQMPGVNYCAGPKDLHSNHHSAHTHTALRHAFILPMKVTALCWLFEHRIMKLAFVICAGRVNMYLMTLSGNFVFASLSETLTTWVTL